jgi:ribosome assembly protein 4
VSYHPTGTRRASGGGDRAVRFWHVTTSLPQYTCLGHQHHVLCTAWSPNGDYFLSADRSGEIRVWDPVTGQPRGRGILTGHSKYVTSLSFEPYHVNPESSRVASGSKDSTIKIWNILTGQCERTISGHTDSIESVKWGGSGLLYTASRDRTIKVWAIDGAGRSREQLVRTLTGHAHRINSLALNCDHVLRTGPYQLGGGGGGAVSSSRNNTNTNNNHHQYHHQKSAEEIESLRVIAYERYRTCVGDNNNNNHNNNNMDIDQIGIEEAGTIDITKAQSESQSSSINIRGKGEILVSGSDDFTLCLWHPQVSKHPIARLTGHQQLVNHIAFSPDSRYIASASFDKKVKLWCGKTGRFLTTFTGHVAAVYQISWSPDSQYLASASKDSTVKIWSLLNPKKAMYTLSGHADEVYTLDWSPDGRSLASGSKDRTIKIWHH